MSPSREKAKAFLERIKFAKSKTLARKNPNLDYSWGLIIRVSWLGKRLLARRRTRLACPFPQPRRSAKESNAYTYETAAPIPVFLRPGNSNNLLFTDFSANKIASITTGGAVTESQEFQGSAPVGITAGIGSQILFLGVRTNHVYKTVAPR